MIDENIQSGDLIIFEKTQQLNNGDVGCFGIEDNIATCKKYFNDSKQNCIILQLQMINILQLLLMNIIIMNLKSLENLPLLFLKELKLKLRFK